MGDFIKMLVPCLVQFALRWNEDIPESDHHAGVSRLRQEAKDMSLKSAQCDYLLLSFMNTLLTGKVG